MLPDFTLIIGLFCLLAVSHHRPKSVCMIATASIQHYSFWMLFKPSFKVYLFSYIIKFKFLNLNVTLNILAALYCYADKGCSCIVGKAQVLVLACNIQFRRNLSGVVPTQFDFLYSLLIQAKV
jgi:hypothetical protein